ncbi:MAG: PAS domain S-box protein, partial [Cyanobacteria bacterium J06650_10]
MSKDKEILFVNQKRMAKVGLLQDFALLFSLFGFHRLVVTVNSLPLNQVTDEKILDTETLLNVAGSLIVVFDRQGKIKRFNRTCETTTGYSEREVLNHCVWDFLLVPEERGSMQGIFRQFVGGQTNTYYESTWLGKSGEMHVIAWSNTVLKDPLGQVDFIVSSGIEVTEQRRSRRQLEGQYRQSHLLAEITQKVRQSLELEEILQTTVCEVQALLGCDHVFILQAQDADTFSTAVSLSSRAAGTADSRAAAGTADSRAIDNKISDSKISNFKISDSKIFDSNPANSKPVHSISSQPRVRLAAEALASVAQGPAQSILRRPWPDNPLLHTSYLDHYRQQSVSVIEIASVQKRIIRPGATQNTLRRALRNASQSFSRQTDAG